MKKSIFLLLFSSIFFLSNCNQTMDVNTALDNLDTRNEIFSSIVGDHEMMMGLMEFMMNNEHAMMMVKGNNKMMGMMMGDGKMMGDMMKDKPEMMHNMMKSMTKDGKMMGHMMEMMHEGEMMSEECMQSCMKMMNDKGLDMGEMKHEHE